MVEEKLLFLVERLAAAVGAAVRPHLPATLAKMRQSLQADDQPHRTATLRLLRMLPVFGEHLEGCVLRAAACAFVSMAALEQRDYHHIA